MSVDGILFSQMTPRTEDVERFHRWYNEDHIPARLQLPHFTRATRYEPRDDAEGYLAIYEVDSLEAFRTPGYLDLKRAPSAETEVMLGRVSDFTRYICEQIGDTGYDGSSRSSDSEYLSVVAFAVPQDETDQFNTWYAAEHVPLLLDADDWLRVRRYRVVNGVGGTWTHIAVHEIASLEVMNSPERSRARSGPLRAPLSQRDWFRQSGRWLYRTLGSQLASSTPPTEIKE